MVLNPQNTQEVSTSLVVFRAHLALFIQQVCGLAKGCTFLERFVFISNYFYWVYVMCFSISPCVRVQWYPQRPEKGVDHLELELQGVVSC